MGGSVVKCVVLICDGMADRPLEELGGRTPIEEASTPNMDLVAKNGKNGLALTIPRGMPAGSDVANLSILGYDPRTCYNGRGPLEAASMGVDLKPLDVAFRCNLITERDGRIADYSAGHIPSVGAAELILALDKRLGGKGARFYPGVGYRHLLVLDCGVEAECTPPHDVVGEAVRDHLPRGEHSDLLRELIVESREVLRNHPVNVRRIRAGENPANLIWPWGQGHVPVMEGLDERYGLKGAIISAVDLVKGLGVYAGLRVISVPGATGYFDTDYRAKAEYAVRCLDQCDLVVVHVEAADEAGHIGSVEEKLRAIENFDRHIAGGLLDQLPVYDEYKLLLMPDHPTPISLGTHTSDPVPFALYRTDHGADYVTRYSERAASDGVFGLVEGWGLMDLMVRDSPLVSIRKD